METYISIGIGVIIVGLVGYIWSFAMTPPKCKVAHKEIMDEIKLEFKEMKEFLDLAIENKILKELRRVNGHSKRD